MPYVDPNTIHNPTAGTVAPAAWGDVVRDDLDFFANPPRCRVYNSATISHATSGTWQALTFNSERVDTDTMHSTSVNTGRITFTTAGFYLVGGNVYFAGSGTGERLARIRIGGATEIASFGPVPGSGGNGNHLPISTVYAFTAGQYIELEAWQNSGAALNMTAAANTAPEFWAVLLAVA